MLQRLPLEIFHDDEGEAALFANVVDGADVGVIKRRGGLRLAAKTAQRSGVADHVIGKKFKCDEAVQARVFGFVNDAHASAAEFLDHFVVRDVLPDHDLETSATPGENSVSHLRCGVEAKSTR